MFSNCAFRIKLVLLITGWLFTVQQHIVYGQSSVHIPETQVAQDFRKLLARPATDPRPYSVSHVSDTVIIEKVFFIRKKLRKCLFLFTNQFLLISKNYQ